MAEGCPADCTVVDYRGMSTVGRLLVATPPMDDPNFERSVVLILRHDPEGAFGLVISRPSTEVSIVDDGALSLWIQQATTPAVLFEGGPVEQNAIIALTPWDGSEERSWVSHVGAGLATVDLESDGVNALDCRELRLFVGYSGWGPLQLDGEIAAGHWFVVAAEPVDPFDHNPTTLWRRVLERDPAHREWVRTFPDDPGLN